MEFNAGNVHLIAGVHFNENFSGRAQATTMSGVKITFLKHNQVKLCLRYVVLVPKAYKLQ